MHGSWYSRRSESGQDEQIAQIRHEGVSHGITFYLADAVPIAKNRQLRWKVQTFHEQMEQAGKHSREEIDQAAANEQVKHLEMILDAGHGNCYLSNRQVAEIVYATLWANNGRKYQLHGWCIMPNHVHVAATFYEGVCVAGTVHSWRELSIGPINQVLSRRGLFWEQDFLGRLLSENEDFQCVATEIENNPVRAGLAELPEDWLWSSARLKPRVDSLFPTEHS